MKKKREFSKVLKSDGIIYTVFRGAINIEDVGGLLESSELKITTKNLFELVEHDVYDLETKKTFPYDENMEWINSILAPNGYSFFAMYYCNKLSHGYCNQMKMLISSDTVVVKLFSDRDKALSWLKDMIFTVGF